MFHSFGGQLHQATDGASGWSLIALDPVQLDDYSLAVFEEPLSPPGEGRVLRPTNATQRACVACTRKPVAWPRQSRKFWRSPRSHAPSKKDLIHALVTCLIKANEERAAKRHHALVMTRFEEVLAQHLGRTLRMPELCERVGVSEQTLRSSCLEFLAITPTRYVLLRRLNAVRRALLDGEPGLAECSRDCTPARLHPAGPICRGIPRSLWRKPIEHVAARCKAANHRPVILAESA
jgi:AraC-like DNA-binding protein